MLVFVSVDLEGVAGVATLDQAYRGGSGYPSSQRLMTAEVNAAVAGAFEAGAEQVVVNDSHDTMDNLLLDQVDERATVVVGQPKAQCMMQGLDARADVALLLGYHAAAGEPGVLAHTFANCFVDFRLNDETVSEAHVAALQAATLGVPVGLLTGDDRICATARRDLPGAEVVEVKQAAGHLAIAATHPRRAQQEIRAATVRAVKGAHRLRPAPLPDRLVLDVDVVLPEHAELAALVPGAQQTGARSVRIEADGTDELIGIITVFSRLAPTRTL